MRTVQFPHAALELCLGLSLGLLLCSLLAAVVLLGGGGGGGVLGNALFFTLRFGSFIGRCRLENLGWGKKDTFIRPFMVG
jgi:hypothetical protein